MSPTVTATHVQRFYRFHAAVYDKTRWMVLHGRRQAVAKLALRADSSVLEVGCGTGLNFPYLVEALDARRGSLVGLDFTTEMLVRARQRIERCGWSNVEIVEGDATTMDLGRQFDGVLFAYSLTTIPDYAAALERAKAHLRPGGRIVVLDFSTFEGWGLMAPVMRLWLQWNHVETQRPYVATLRALFDDVTVQQWLAGYNFTAWGTNTTNE
jgi:ubiquinone/menaquinone biosynthesis C-methylase UbiE